MPFLCLLLSQPNTSTFCLQNPAVFFLIIALALVHAQVPKASEWLGTSELVSSIGVGVGQCEQNFEKKKTELFSRV